MLTEKKFLEVAWLGRLFNGWPGLIPWQMGKINSGDVLPIKVRRQIQAKALKFTISLAREIWRDQARHWLGNNLTRLEKDNPKLQVLTKIVEQVSQKREKCIIFTTTTGSGESAKSNSQATAQPNAKRRALAEKQLVI